MHTVQHNTLYAWVLAGAVVYRESCMRGLVTYNGSMRQRRCLSHAEASVALRAQCVRVR